MAGLIRGSLEETDGWEVAGADGREEILNIVLIVRRIARVTNRHDGRGPRVRGVSGRRIELERIIVNAVVALSDARVWRSGASATPGGAVGIHDAEIEAAYEPAPGDAGVGEAVPDIRTGHIKLFLSGGAADIADRVNVGDHRGRPVAAVGQGAGAVKVLQDAVRLAGNQVQVTEQGSSENGS